MSYRPVVAESFQKTWRDLPPHLELQEAVLDFMDRLADDPGAMTQRGVEVADDGLVSQPLVVTLDEARFVLFIEFIYDADEETIHVRNLSIRQVL